MPTTHHIRPLAGAATAILCVVALLPATGQAAARTKTLRVFSQERSLTYTTAASVVSHQPPAGAPQPGDVLEIDSVDFIGNHRHHARHWSISDHLQCTFGTGPEPDCLSWVADGGSLLRFQGNELIGGTGRYLRATGRVVKNQEVAGGSDIVARIHLH